MKPPKRLLQDPLKRWEWCNKRIMKAFPENEPEVGLMDPRMSIREEKHELSAPKGDQQEGIEVWLVFHGPLKMSFKMGWFESVDWSVKGLRAFYKKCRKCADAEFYIRYL